MKVKNITLPSSSYLTGTHFCGEYINNLKYQSHSPQHIDISRPIVKANCANIPKMTWQYQHWDLIWGGGEQSVSTLDIIIQQEVIGHPQPQSQLDS